MGGGGAPVAGASGDRLASSPQRQRATTLLHPDGQHHRGTGPSHQPQPQPHGGGHVVGQVRSGITRLSRVGGHWSRAPMGRLIPSIRITDVV